MVAGIRVSWSKQEAIKKGMAFAKKHASGDICGDWECKMISEWTT